jgi:hypothetical protein
MVSLNSLMFTGPAEARGQTRCQYYLMYPSEDDPFNYIEVEQVEGLSMRLDPSEVVLLTHNNARSLAVVTLNDNKGVLLRSRVELPTAGGKVGTQSVQVLLTLSYLLTILCFLKLFA